MIDDNEHANSRCGLLYWHSELFLQILDKESFRPRNRRSFLCWAVALFCIKNSFKKLWSYFKSCTIKATQQILPSSHYTRIKNSQNQAAFPGARVALPFNDHLQFTLASLYACCEQQEMVTRNLLPQVFNPHSKKILHSSSHIVITYTSEVERRERKGPAENEMDSPRRAVRGSEGTVSNAGIQPVPVCYFRCGGSVWNWCIGRTWESTK